MFCGFGDYLSSLQQEHFWSILLCQDASFFASLFLASCNSSITLAVCRSVKEQLGCGMFLCSMAPVDQYPCIKAKNTTNLLKASAANHKSTGYCFPWEWLLPRHGHKPFSLHWQWHNVSHHLQAPLLTFLGSAPFVGHFVVI